MTRHIDIQHPSQFGSMTRTPLGAEAAGNFAADVMIGALALVGAPVTRAMGAVRSGMASWAEARRQRRADEQLWNLALSDARIMADLSRAMSDDALRDGHGA
jgi:phage-related minor tail protein